MAWDLAEAAYTSPKGTRQTFSYESVERNTALKTAEFIFPEFDGAEIQSLGIGGKKFPLKCIFYGADCMSEADAFEGLLCERGVGVLEHPVYGIHNVVPTGEIKRADNLVSELNQSVVTVTFALTIADGDVPTAVADLGQKVSDTADAAAAVSVGVFEAALNSGIAIAGDSASNANFLSTLRKSKENYFNGLRSISKYAKKLNSELKQKIDAMEKIVTDFIDAGGGAITDVAWSFVNSARLLSRASIDVMAKVEGYSAVLKTILGNGKKDLFVAQDVKKQCLLTRLQLTALMGGMFSSAQGGDFFSRGDVETAAGYMHEAFASYRNYIDGYIAEDTDADGSDEYRSNLMSFVFAVQGMRLGAAELPMARTVRLNADSQMMEILGAVYGKNFYAHVDEFIVDNRLTPDEILLLPMGREISYYVASVQS